MPSLTLTPEDAVTLPEMGIVTGTVTYSNGTSATREEPGEEAGIEDVSLKDASGTNLDPEMILEDDARLHALEQAVWMILAVEEAAQYASYAAEVTP
jgi:hypothetical protein